ncbi:hypothetical protein V492_01958 [Pseudogymnoascus sp. VKM F-4246]|nr:hypothetical protein V492_01958 [Pseudogymnoascus sp. VKM F-4246]
MELAFPLDGSRATLSLAMPEGGSLGFTSIDNYRALAGAASMAKLNIISNELSAHTNSAYGASWAKVLAMAFKRWPSLRRDIILHLSIPGVTDDTSK